MPSKPQGTQWTVQKLRKSKEKEENEMLSLATLRDVLDGNVATVLNRELQPFPNKERVRLLKKRVLG